MRKSNILILTSLYPENEYITPLSGETSKRVSKAIHYLAQGLYKFDINLKKVIRPEPQNSWRELKFNKKRFVASKIDNILVETRSFFNIPKLGSIVLPSDRRYIKEAIKDIDLIVAHMPDETKMAYEIKKRFGTPFISVLHEYDLKNIKRQKEFLKSAKAVYARSWSLRDRALNYGVDIDGIVYSGIEEEFIIKRDRFNSRSEIKFITVSPLAKSKNIDTILKVLKELPSKFEWSYTVIGDGVEFENLVNLSKKYNLDDRVSFLGKKNRKECISYMQRSDIFLMPSYPETFGLAYLEAMASGCIVVCGKGAGVDGMIKDRYNGYVVKPRDEEGLRRVFLDIFLKDQNEILKNSFKTINNFTLSKAWQNYADIINKNILK